MIADEGSSTLADCPPLLPLRLVRSYGTSAMTATIAQRLFRKIEVALADRAGYRTHPHLGLRLAVDRSVSKLMRNAISRGVYEATEVRLLPPIVRSDDSVLEIGSGLGFVAALLMSQCRPRAYCAVEADARLIPLIHRTLSLNGVTSGVDVECAILTQDAAILRKGSASFIVAKDFWNSRISETEAGIEVPAVSLNERLRSRAVTFLIVDIEGGEATLFDGVDLSSVRAMFVEMHVEIIGESGMQKLIDRFQEQGFEYRGGLFLRT
jgi:FkbM family methyltransferase